MGQLISRSIAAASKQSTQSAERVINRRHGDNTGISGRSLNASRSALCPSIFIADLTAAAAAAAAATVRTSVPYSITNVS